MFYAISRIFVVEIASIRWRWVRKELKPPETPYKVNCVIYCIRPSRMFKFVCLNLESVTEQTHDKGELRCLCVYCVYSYQVGAFLQEGCA